MLYANLQDYDAPINILIVGAGATGSYLTNFLARNLTALNLKNIDIVVIDFDRVEEKNLLNQNFIKSDLKKYKAEVIAQRYSKIYSNLYYIINKIEYAINNFLNMYAIIVLCVDNFETRLKIFHHCSRFLISKIIAIIDTGVHENGGQTLLFPISHSSQYYNIRHKSGKQIFDGFKITDIVPWHIMLSKNNVSKVHCGNGILPIWNIIGASLATSFIIKILTKKTIKYLGIFFGDKYKFYDCDEFYNMIRLVQGGYNDKRNNV